MKLKRELATLKKSELINLAELATLCEIPYNTLIQYQRRFQILPTSSNSENKEKKYDRKNCEDVIKWFLKLKGKGFKLSYIKKELLKTKSTYVEMWENLEM